MKSLKKVLVFVLAFTMVLGLAVVASAAELQEDTATTYSITIKNEASGHTYEAYQIFKGDLSENEEGSKVLSSVEWGDDIIATTIDGKTAQEWADALAEGEESAADFAEKVLPYLVKNPSHSTSEHDGTQYVIDNLDAGYYLVKDKNNSLAGLDDAYTSFILKVVGDVTMKPKSDVPSVGKEVYDYNDSDVKDPTNGWHDSADHDIGDDVAFRLTGTLPDNYDDYTTYKYVFHDKLSDGLTYNGDYKVYVINGDEKVEIVSGFYLKDDCDGEHNLCLACDDLNSVQFETGKESTVISKTSKIVVEYTAKLNENAVIGNYGNPNEVYLEFSNNPNPGGEGETGNTEKEEAVVFTYELDVNKVDETEEHNPLPGAEFTLEKFVEIERGGEHDDEIQDAISNGKTGKWVTVKVVVTEAGTKFEFKGLDAGWYRLKETKAPEGYNKLAEPIEFEIKASHTKSETTVEEIEAGEMEFTVNNDPNGHISTDIENRQGAQLPETGGIGTTIFYVVGGLLVVFAGVLLITKRRMKAED